MKAKRIPSGERMPNSPVTIQVANKTITKQADEWIVELLNRVMALEHDKSDR